MEAKELAVKENGYEAKLTGDQVRFIRTMLGESQATFAMRFAVQQPVIFRLEKKRTVEQGPIIILIDMLAKQFSIEVPEKPIRRPDPEPAAAAE
ncbi:hypothetical protein PMI07_000824 [Rhizobium sp. CF080]|uniref:hypothetical protein n=1 Tax=Rhizobium sp. (strain CF080) TaxID=1144310 RepID=UPI000271D61E|nr:hypothetical protein [Rhizobium sp. CF080]EUB97248.1 hypothetical protein PMI07_000824 [Rhizobium sp. CF080]